MGTIPVNMKDNLVHINNTPKNVNKNLVSIKLDNIDTFISAHDETIYNKPNEKAINAEMAEVKSTVIGDNVIGDTVTTTLKDVFTSSPILGIFETSNISTDIFSSNEIVEKYAMARANISNIAPGQSANTPAASEPITEAQNPKPVQEVKESVEQPKEPVKEAVTETPKANVNQPVTEAPKEAPKQETTPAKEEPKQEVSSPKTYNSNNKVNLKSGTSTISTSEPVMHGKEYNLSKEDLAYLAYVAKKEQGTLEGAKLELSLMANLYEKRGSKYSSIESYVKHSGWFSGSSTKNYKYPGDEYVNAANDILCEGNRYLSSDVVEHDYIGDISSATNNGVPISRSDRSAYIPGVTVIKNRYGAKYVFDGFAPNGGDPFGHYV